MGNSIESLREELARTAYAVLSLLLCTVERLFFADILSVTRCFFFNVHGLRHGYAKLVVLEATDIVVNEKVDKFDVDYFFQHVEDFLNRSGDLRVAVGNSIVRIFSEAGCQYLRVEFGIRTYSMPVKRSQLVDAVARYKACVTSR